MSQQREPLRVGIGGGKGGVGKSVVAANLACALAQLGRRVTLVDADLGAANLHTMFGIDRPGLTLQALIDKQIDSLSEAVIATPFPGVSLVPGSGAVVGAANVGHAQKLKLIRHINTLEADVVLVDCGAGSSFNVVDLFSATDVKLLVATPQLTSLQNAYGFLKSAVYRSLRARAASPAERDLLTLSSDRSETERMRELFDRIASHDLEFAEQLARVVDTFSIRIVGNQLESNKQHGVLHALARMMRDFLAIEAPVAATIPLTGSIHRSVTARIPFFFSRSSSPEGRALLQLARSLLETDLASLRSRRESERPVPRSGSLPPGATEGKLPGLLSRYLRRHARVQVSWQATVEGDQGKHACQITDISLGGASLRGDVPINVGDGLVLRTELASGVFAANVEVRNVDEERFGVQFTGDAAVAVGKELVALAKALQAA